MLINVTMFVATNLKKRFAKSSAVEMSVVDTWWMNVGRSLGLRELFQLRSKQHLNLKVKLSLSWQGKLIGSAYPVTAHTPNSLRRPRVGKSYQFLHRYNNLDAVPGVAAGLRPRVLTHTRYSSIFGLLRFLWTENWLFVDIGQYLKGV